MRVDKYPCEHCDRREGCNGNGTTIGCGNWQRWFVAQWRKNTRQIRLLSRGRHVRAFWRYEHPNLVRRRDHGSD